MRKWVVFSWLAFLSMGIIALFWHSEWVYSLPTPIPAAYKPVERGTFINERWKGNQGDKRPVFLHFFNPDCPCSRFNVPMFASLEKQYGRQVNFAIVVMSRKAITAEQVRERFHLDVPVLFDSTIAVACGVYSTPQAVIIDEDQKLYYRGNYNRNRYCTDEKSSYAKQALEGLLHHQLSAGFSPYALKAYGCQLPNCNK